jgi:hypothetical protein
VLLGLGVLILLGGGVVAVAYYQSLQIYRVVKSIQPDLTAARNALAKGQVPPGDPFASATVVAARAQDEVDHANVAFKIAGAIPFFNRPIQAVRLGVDAASHEARAASIMRDMVLATLGKSALAAQTVGGERQEAPVFRNGTIDVGLIQSLTPKLEEVIRELGAGDADIRAIPSIPFVHRLDSLKTDALGQSARAISLAQGALSGVKLLPSFMGADRPRTYFLALQNNSDQRATGGAVLAYAFLRVDKGRLQLIASGPIYDFDSVLGFRATLPSDLSWYLQHLPKTYPRVANVNFSPNFPVVAQGWSNLIRSAVGQRIDGAIAVDPIAIGLIMGSKQVRVPTIPAAITGRNVVRVIENQQYLLSKEQRAVFPAQIIRAAWKIFSNPSPFVRTMKQFQTALSQKDIQIWSTDPSQQALLTTLGWDGGFRNVPGDYLYVADNKLLASKVDFYSRLHIEDHVVIEASGQITATCRIQLVNETPPNLPPAIIGPNAYGLNKALINLYVPPGAELKSPPASRSLPPHLEGGKKVFLREVKSLPGHPGVAEFTYTVPGVMQTVGGHRVYQLTIQRQPMVNPADITVTVTLPKGSVVASMGPGWTVEGNVATFHTVLLRDLTTRISF